MASKDASKFVIVDVDRHNPQIPATGTLPSPGKIGTFKAFDSNAMLQFPSRYTPHNESFRNTSPASSARSSSSTSSVFDDDLSPAETPPTAPLSKQLHPLSSSRQGLKNTQNVSKLSFVDKDAKQCGSTPGSSTSLTVQSSPGTPQGSITPVLEHQIAEQEDLQSVDYFTLDFAQMKLEESPMSQKLRRRKHDQEVIKTVNAISTQFSSSNFGRSNNGPGNRGDGTEPAEHKLYQESLAAQYTTSCVPDHHSIKLDGDGHDMSISSLEELDERRSKTGEGFPGSSAAELLVVKRSHQEQRLQSYTTPFLHPPRSGSSPENSARSSPPEQLGADIKPKTNIPKELEKGFDSVVGSKPVQSSCPKTPAARKSRKSSSSQHGNKVPRVTKSIVRRPSGQTSSSVEEKGLGSPDEAHAVDIASTKDMNVSILGQKKAPKAKSVSKVTSHVFEKKNAIEKSSNELKLEILNRIRRRSHEDKLSKYLDNPFIALLPHRIQKYFLPHHVLPSHERDQGFIYIFKSDACPGHVKIGKTKQMPEIRTTQWSKQCKFTCIHIVHPDDKSFYHYGLVEKLVEAELWNLRRKFKCGNCKKQSSHEYELEKGPTEHGEWYEITETQALEIVQKWRKWFVEYEPYLQTGALRQYWKWKHDQAMKGGEVDWVKWRLTNWYEHVQYFWYCLHRTIADYFKQAIALIVFLGVINLFLPSDGYCLRVMKLVLGFGVLCITYGYIYY
ncbi:hypothetical protein VTL71DRAFT_14525 [Oculimacula yallundae]|uniref:Bacteriophage T5 Orf172 DNA-binding domain-containing protein n=1 Tax=Oculimacula yallundae TaxID=86028 RepID=A0ABR4CK36_9HELO